MSTRVDVDIDELERFAAQLQAFNKKLEDATYQIKGQLDNLGSSWRDDQYKKFTEEWRSTFNVINRYIDQQAPQYVRSLKIKAAKLRDARG
jgi:uncharacterized protein YukE